MWAISTHIDKYLVEKYFRHSSVAVLLVFTSLIGIVMLPFIWWYQPHVLDLPAVSIAVIMASGLRHYRHHSQDRHEHSKACAFEIGTRISVAPEEYWLPCLRSRIRLRPRKPSECLGLANYGAPAAAQAKLGVDPNWVSVVSWKFGRPPQRREDQ